MTDHRLSEGIESESSATQGSTKAAKWLFREEITTGVTYLHFWLKVCAPPPHERTAAATLTGNPQGESILCSQGRKANVRYGSFP